MRCIAHWTGQRPDIARTSDSVADRVHADPAHLLALTLFRGLPRHLGACESAIFLGKDAAQTKR
ncbi:MAG: hypothetical protein AAFW60_01490, partial [Pseudomonadota bacterium]